MNVYIILRIRKNIYFTACINYQTYNLYTWREFMLDMRRTVSVNIACLHITCVPWLTLNLQICSTHVMCFTNITTCQDILNNPILTIGPKRSGCPECGWTSIELWRTSANSRMVPGMTGMLAVYNSTTKYTRIIFCKHPKVWFLLTETCSKFRSCLQEHF